MRNRIYIYALLLAGLIICVTSENIFAGGVEMPGDLGTGNAGSSGSSGSVDGSHATKWMKYYRAKNNGTMYTSSEPMPIVPQYRGTLVHDGYYEGNPVYYPEPTVPPYISAECHNSNSSADGVWILGNVTSGKRSFNSYLYYTYDTIGGNENLNDIWSAFATPMPVKGEYNYHQTTFLDNNGHYGIYRTGSSGEMQYNTISSQNIALNNISWGGTSSVSTMYYGTKSGDTYTDVRAYTTNSTSIAGGVKDIVDEYINFMVNSGKYSEEDIKTAKGYSNYNDAYNKLIKSKGIYAFCSYPEAADTPLQAKVSLTVDGTQIESGWDKSNVSTSITVHSSPISISTDFDFKRGVESPNMTFKASIVRLNEKSYDHDFAMTSSELNNQEKKVQNISLSVGANLVCSSVKHPEKISGGDNSNRSKNKEAKACVTVVYEPYVAAIDSKTTLTVKDASIESSTDADGELNLGRVPYGARAITAIWSYNLSSSSRCIESNFNGTSCSKNNSSITSDFKVNYKRSGLAYNDSNYDDQFVTLRNSKYSSSVGSNTKTYNLLPGEQLTQKQGISHYSGVHTDSTPAERAKEESSSVTLNATASDVICGLNNQPFGLGNPVNYGRMTVVKNGNRTYAYGDNLVDGNLAWSDAGDIWLKPTDTVQLIYEACIGEQIQKDKNSGKKWGDAITEGNAVLTVGTSNNTLDSTHYKGIGGAVDVDSIDDKNIVAYEKIGDTISKHISNEYQFVGNEEAAKSDAKAVEHLGQTITNDFGNISNDIHATMKIPYNYYMSLNLIDDGSKGYLTSESTTFKVEVENEGRINNQVCNGAPACDAYATKSKKTTAGMLVFTISSEFKAEDLKEGKDSFSYNGNIFDSANDLLLKNRMVEAVKNHLPYGDSIDVIDSSHVKEEEITNLEFNDGGTGSIESNVLDLSDLAVGTKVCAVAAVYPSDSHDTGYDTDYNRPEDDPKHWPIDDSRHWEINDLKQSAAFSPTGTKTGLKVSCRTVAKHQNMSVEGNGVVTTQRISSSTTTHKATNGEKIFRSWSEYQIISGGSNASSGAVTAYALDNTATKTENMSANPEISSVESKKYLYPQTLGNFDLSMVGGVTSDPNSGDESEVNWRYSETLIKNIVDTYGKGGGDCVSGDLPTSNNYLECINGGSLPYVYKEGKDTLVVKSTGTLTINNDSHLDDLSYWGNPKQLIIIAKDILIDKSVSRVNAWLIVDGGKLNTCNDYQINAPEDKSNQNLLDFCNTQLFINGPVVVNGDLILPRTFGGGSVLENGKFVKDSNTLVQRAEIFNYDPSVVEWAYRESQKNPHLETTYTETLAPRL